MLVPSETQLSPTPRPAPRHRGVIDARAAHNKRFYDAEAGGYADATGDAGLGVPVDDFVAALPQRARVVDLGSGSGRDLAAFLARGVDACGLDFSAELAGLARSRSGAPVVVADMCAIPFADGTFDGAWACASLLHMGGSAMHAALAEAHRVLRPGGFLFTSMKRGRGERVEPCGRWFSYVEPEAWRERLRAADFEIVESGCNVEDRQAGPIRWLTCLARRR